jgi:hypothetical protein
MCETTVEICRWRQQNGTQGLFVENRGLVYFSVLHDPFGQFKGAVIVGKDGIEKQLPLDQTRKWGAFEREKIALAIGPPDPVHEKRQTRFGCSAMRTRHNFMFRCRARGGPCMSFTDSKVALKEAVKSTEQAAFLLGAPRPGRAGQNFEDRAGSATGQAKETATRDCL